MNRAATIALAPFSALYGAAVQARSTGYEKQFLKTVAVKVPVISVGNITVGGTGKTPLVEWIARQLSAVGQGVCILTRGYRRKDAKQRVVVSDGERILSDVAHAGDEAMMLAQALLGKASVVCDADRVAGAQYAIDKLSAEVLLLDDGFQHRRLARDLDIVIIDSSNPFGNKRLLPAGILREPVSSLSRADCIMLTRAFDEPAPELLDRIREVTAAPVVASRTMIESVRRLNGDEGDHNSARQEPLVAFCGLGNSAAFFNQLRAGDFELRSEISFRDHHKYSQTDIDRITEQALTHGAQALITTAKDAVKLQSLSFEVPCYVAQIQVELSDTSTLLALIEQAIRRKQ